MRDVLELLRDFLRAKALTESEISREVRVLLFARVQAERVLLRRVSPRSQSSLVVGVEGVLDWAVSVLHRVRCTRVRRAANSRHDPCSTRGSGRGHPRKVLTQLVLQRSTVFRSSVVHTPAAPLATLA